MDCFQSQSTVDICIAGLNRRAGYATANGYKRLSRKIYKRRNACDTHPCLVSYHVFIVQES